MTRNQLRISFLLMCSLLVLQTHTGFWNDVKEWFENIWRSDTDRPKEHKGVVYYPGRFTPTEKSETKQVVFEQKTSPSEQLPLEHVISYGVAENQGKRPYMEDRNHILVIKENVCYLAGVFDGHGGSNTAEYLQDHLTSNILDKIRFTESETFDTCTQTSTINITHNNISESMIKGFIKTNDDLKEQIPITSSGSTAVVAYINAHTDDLYLANVGDSRAVGSNGQALTHDHTGKNESEVARVSKDNIWYVGGALRLGGMLMVTRAFGDFMLEKYGLTAEPEITHFKVSDFDFIILASDGIWDVLDNKQAADYVKQRLSDGSNPSLDRIAQELIIEASCASVKRFTGKIVMCKRPEFFSEEGLRNFSDLYGNSILDKAHDNQTVMIIQFR